jgi:parvulin-like peptidyl-prolyl isomerase
MDVFEVSFEGDDLIRETEKKGIELKTTDFFTRSGPKEIRDRGIFARTAFNLDEGQVSEVLEVKDGFYIVQVIEKKPAGISPFEDVKEKVEKDLLSVKQKQNAREAAESFLAELKKENDLEKVGDKFDKEIISTGFIKRDDSIPDIGREQKINEEAFKLSKENNTPKEVIEGLNGYYVIMFKDRKTPEPEEFEKEKDAVSQSLLIQKKNRLFEKWLTALKDKSEIFIEKDFL